MSSLIPKISIGVDTKKGNHFDLSSLTHTTSEIGYVQPTFSKNIVPKSKVRIGTRTGVRLSPLFVPTMGQIDVRHYHCFVPFSTLWTPFDAFITRTNYTLPDGSTYQPMACPSFRLDTLLSAILGTNELPVVDVKLLDLLTSVACTIYRDGVRLKKSDINTYLDTSAKLKNIFSDNSDLDYKPKNIVFEDANGVDVSYYLDYVNSTYTLTAHSSAEWLQEQAIPTMNTCDFSESFIDSGVHWTICYNWNGAWKRLRTIFLGLGYSFNPFDGDQVTLFKLLGFYKSYWTLFGVNRTVNFYNTNCYKLIKCLSETTTTQITPVSSPIPFALLVGLLRDLTECTYTCPVDYFSSADTTTQRGAQISGGVYSAMSPNYVNSDGSGMLGGLSQTSGVAVGLHYDNGSPDGFSRNDAMYPLAQKIAMRLLRFVNKNSVVGRQISEILRTRYGVSDIHNTTHESVIRVGSNSVPIQISAIYNQSGDSQDMPLGSYGGMGIGSHRSKNFKFSADEFGCLLTLTAVVPKMGYFQGRFKENSDGVKDSYDFYTPEFDAIGWQSVLYSELIADRTHKDASGLLPYGTNLGIFGYQPFYTHNKVGFNRVLGDISIPHLRDSMLPYTLDRYYPDVIQGISNTSAEIQEFMPLPVNEPKSFRSGTSGNTNRIFSDVSKTDDHVIMQIFFDVKMSAPMKSIATSYDTWDEESTHSMDVAHE